MITSVLMPLGMKSYFEPFSWIKSNMKVQSSFFYGFSKYYGVILKRKLLIAHYYIAFWKINHSCLSLWVYFFMLDNALFCAVFQINFSGPHVHSVYLCAG